MPAGLPGVSATAAQAARQGDPCRHTADPVRLVRVFGVTAAAAVCVQPSALGRRAALVIPR
jgi:hypothetical protein